VSTHVNHFRFRPSQSLYSRAYCTGTSGRANVSTESETTRGNHFETIHKTIYAIFVNNGLTLMLLAYRYCQGYHMSRVFPTWPCSGVQTVFRKLVFLHCNRTIDPNQLQKSVKQSSVI